MSPGRVLREIADVKNAEHKFAKLKIPEFLGNMATRRPKALGELVISKGRAKYQLTFGLV